MAIQWGQYPECDEFCLRHSDSWHNEHWKLFSDVNQLSRRSDKFQCAADGPYPADAGITYLAGYPLLNLNGMLSNNFVVQYSTNLASTNWINLLTVPNLQTSSYLFLDPAGIVPPARFYRHLCSDSARRGVELNQFTFTDESSLPSGPKVSCSTLLAMLGPVFCPTPISIFSWT